MRPVTLSRLTVISLILSSAAVPVDAQEINPQLAAAMVRFGGSWIKVVATAGDTTVKASNRPLSEQEAVVQAVLNDYKATKAASESTVLGTRALAEFAVDGTAALMASSVVGAVPALVVKATGQLATDTFIGEMQAEADRTTRNFLANHKDEIINKAGLSSARIRGMDQGEIARQLKQNTTIFSDIEKTLPDDQNAREFSQNLIIQTLTNVQIETLKASKEQSQNLTDVARGFSDYKRITFERLKRHERNLGEMQGAIREVSGSISDLNEKIKSQSRDQSFVADFVFKKMDPQTKSEALKNGFMADKFKCPDGRDQCDSAKLREVLILRFQAEARVQNITNELANTAETLGNVSALANNLGIKIKGLDQAARLGNVASSAFMQAAAGNYLGAAVAVTGMFAAQKNPEEERFKALMGYLQREFQEVNRKLDEILKNQQKIMDAISAVSKQLQKVYVALDERLARIEFDTKRAVYVLGTEAWKEWQGCSAVYLYIKEQDDRFKYFQNQDFRKLDDIYQVLRDREQAVMSCLLTAQSKAVSILEPKWFGNFLDARLAAEFTPEILPGDKKTGEYFNKTELEAYIERVQKPALSLVVQWMTKKKLNPTQIVALTVTPATSVSQIESRVATVARYPRPCDSLEGALASAIRVICGGAGKPDEASMQLLATPMVFDGAEQISNWLMAITRFADLRDSVQNRFLLPAEIFPRSAELNTPGAGRQIVADNLTIIDSAIAGYSLLYGDVLTAAIFEALTEPTSEDKAREDQRKANLEAAIQLVAQNEFLASNVTMMILHNRFGKQLKQRRPGPYTISEEEYATALDKALQEKNMKTRVRSLEGLFGDDLLFSINDSNNTVKLSISAFANHASKDDAEKAVFGLLPSYEFFKAGKISYPSRMTDLLATRTRLRERLNDYDIFARLPAPDRESVAILLARAAKGENEIEQ
jgi:hypothetical protein